VKNVGVSALADDETGGQCHRRKVDVVQSFVQYIADFVKTEKI
jgi:hypothetical protein